MNNPQSLPGAPQYHTVLSALSPPTTLDITEWQQWAHAAWTGCLKNSHNENSLPPALWDMVEDRLLRQPTVLPLDAARILRVVLRSLTPPPTACDVLTQWWDAHREALRLQRSSAPSAQDGTFSPIGEVLLECSSMCEIQGWNTRYASAAMTQAQAAHVLESLTPNTWALLESVIIEWASTEKDSPGLSEMLVGFGARVDCPITKTAQWVELYFAQLSVGRTSPWLLAWLDHGRLPFNPLPPELLSRLLQSPDRPVREYAIRTMAHGRAPHSPLAVDLPPIRPLLY